jgi:peptide/nickel transport system permease protein
MLVTYAGVLIIVIGIVLGTAGGLSRRLGPIVAGISGVMLGIPGFVAAQLLVALLALRWGWFPVQGEGTGFSDRLYHLTMPALALAIPVSAWVAQVTMTAVRDERGREHVDTARGRGIAPGKTVRRHVLRNAALPMVTVSGLAVASLFAGAVVIEQAFNLAGIGSLLVDAVGSKDYNVVLAVSIILVAVFVVVTSVIDVLHVLLDPRIRRGPAK